MKSRLEAYLSLAGVLGVLRFLVVISIGRIFYETSTVQEYTGIFYDETELMATVPIESRTFHYGEQESGERVHTEITTAVKKTSLKLNNQEHQNGDSESSEREASFFYETTWPPVQQALCGTGAPNPWLFLKMFRLAQSEAFAKDDPKLETVKKSEVKWVSETFFFGGYQGAMILKALSYDIHEDIQVREQSDY